MSKADLQRPARERTTRRKAVLFCPTCGHESHARRGDWLVEHRPTDEGDVVAVSCPTCETTLTVEPAFCG
ncbi:hypothetical protein ACFPYI_16035 [Halomarina salina]|uniref:DUF8106 domain-containing protein n=1 Tax=Halomarina salina TaxID=1872699 RepID=A0ABD5RQZ9_9EURY|nr:hypothetical protein [Halomarina salina]